jgi:hypothetical protein
MNEVAEANRIHVGTAFGGALETNLMGISLVATNDS